MARRRLPRTAVGQILAAIAGIGAILLALGVALAGLTAVGVVNALSNGLPDPANLDRLTFAQPTVVYDRTGTVELARFQQQDRRVVTYAEIPQVVLDAVTTAEDRSFWTNGGFDPTSIAAAAVQDVTGSGAGQRGASPITQQLVRATLLPSTALSGDVYLRKVLEIIQSARLTAAFPGETGKEKIITAYLNEAYFGHQAYGIAAAAQIYFGVTDLSKLTAAQAALLAALLKAPSQYDPYLSAVQEPDGRLVVPATAPVVVRRNWVLQNLPGSARWTSLDPAAIAAATAAPVVLSGVQPEIVKAPQFVLQVRAQLEQMLGGAEAVDTGGYKVITTLDWTAQQLAERDVTAAAIAPNLPPAQAAALLAQLGVPKADDGWISRLRGKDLHDGLLVALDYRTGD
ncbi:MAG TPA: transglycosylase domain-containing protein, partial [Candidatus Binatus sp.]|nr:transglycosylase domain-containing protein [Candidatus Binatus sp.]